MKRLEKSEPQSVVVAGDVPPATPTRR